MKASGQDCLAAGLHFGGEGDKDEVERRLPQKDRLQASSALLD